MRLVWWVLFTASLAALASAIVMQRNVHRSGGSRPSYLAGTVSSGLSLVLLTAGNLLGLDTTAGTLAGLGSGALLMLSVGQLVQAARRRS